MNEIEKFINNNNLDFSGSGSDLNGACVVLAGYALYLGMDLEVLFTKLFIDSIETSDDVEEELERVYKYADENNYGDWWKNPNAHTIYKFDEI